MSGEEVGAARRGDNVSERKITFTYLFHLFILNVVSCAHVSFYFIYFFGLFSCLFSNFYALYTDEQ